MKKLEEKEMGNDKEVDIIDIADRKSGKFCRLKNIFKSSFLFD